MPFSTIQFFKQLNIFKRNKKPIELKIIALLDYVYHGSVRGVAKKLSKFFADISKTSVHRYAKKFQRLIKLVEVKERKLVAVDETVVKVNGKHCYVWIAVDAETKEVVCFDVSKGRSYLDALAFMKKVKARCKGKLPLVLVDKGPWYK